ncbi:MAG: hypothetical protein L6Q77_14515 [Bacteroidetes bacterium]|nr:hypothetical protein [Bacteroidota bacterium]
MIWIFLSAGSLVLLLIYSLVIRPAYLIRKSGIDLTLSRFFQLQSQGFPTVRLLEITARFRAAGIQLTWEDIDLFFGTVRAEMLGSGTPYKKPPVELFSDVLTAIDLVKGEGYVLSFQNAMMQVLAGKNPREIAASFVHLMWSGEQKTKP